jgi:hypothetical protein
MHFLSLSSLPRGKVASGTACLLAMVPEEWVLSFPPVDPTTQMLDGDIVLHPTRAWLRLYLVSRRRPLREEQQRTPAGIIWQQQVQGRTAGQSVTIHEYLRNMAPHRWVILYQETGTDITYVIGRPGSGALLDANYSNEVSTFTTISLTRTSITRAYVYRGTFTLDNGQIIDSGATLGVYPYTASGTENLSFTIPALRYKTILWVSRAGMEDLTPVEAPPDSFLEIQYTPSTGTFTVHPDRPIAYQEKFAILYK